MQLRHHAKRLTVLIVASAAIPLAGAATAPAASSSGTSTFTATGALQTWTVPAGVKSIELELVGGRGGKGGVACCGYGTGYGPPSAAAKVSLRVAVTPGDELTIGVGGNGADGSYAGSAASAGGIVAAGYSRYSGGVGGRAANYPGSQTGGGAGGAASFVTVDDADYVAGGGGGGGGDGWDTTYTSAGGVTTRPAWDWLCTDPAAEVCPSWTTTSLGILFTAPMGRYVPDQAGEPVTPGGAGYGYLNPIPSPDGTTSKLQPDVAAGGGGGGGGGVRGGMAGYFGLGYRDSAQPGTRGESTSGEGVTVEDAALTDSGSVKISWALPDKPTVTGAPTKLSNLSSVSLELSGEEGATFECDRDADWRGACTSPWQIDNLEAGDWPSTLVPGQHKMQVRQIDRYGQASPWQTVGWFTDRTAPAKPAIGGNPPAVTSSRSATFTFAATEPDLPDGVTCSDVISSGLPCLDTFQCRIDGGAWDDDCASPAVLTGLPDGRHTFELRAVDGAGNASESASRTWQVTEDATLTQTETYRYTEGGWRIFTVPAGVTTLSVDIRGGRGGTGGDDVQSGGPPQPQGRVTGTVPVTPGDQIRIGVGANGRDGTDCMPGVGGAGGEGISGMNGGKGGDAGLPDGCSGGGGGGGAASVIQLANGFSDFVAARDAVTAGGGGGGYGGGAFAAPRFFQWKEIVSGQWYRFTPDPTAPLLSTFARGTYDDLVSGDGYADGIVGTAGQGWGNTLDPAGLEFKGGPWDGGGAGGGGGGIAGGLGGWVPEESDRSAQPGRSGKNRAGDYRDLSEFLTASYDLADEGSVTLSWFGPDSPTITAAPTGRTRSTSATVRFTGLPGATFTCSIDGAAAAPCTSPFALSALSVGEHTVSVTQTVSGVASVPSLAQWTVEPPFVAPTVTAARPTVTKRSARWVLALGAAFTDGGDSRSPAQLMTVQISTATSRPSNSQSIPSRPTYADGIVAWATEVSRQSIARPRWVRVGNRAGRWTGWVALSLD